MTIDEVLKMDHNGSFLEEYCQAFNDFLTSGIEVCDVKITTATAGYSDNMNVLTTIMVLYK